MSHQRAATTQAVLTGHQGAPWASRRVPAMVLLAPALERLTGALTPHEAGGPV